MPNIIAYDRNRSKTALITAPRTDAGLEGRKAGPFTPMLTWADWELLQELHKARNGEGTAITVQFAPPPELNAGYRPDLFPSYDKQYESLARPEGSMSQAAVDAIAKIGGDPLPRAGKPAMNWQAVAADLQDQIKDWETKCLQLETDKCTAQAQLKTAIDTKNRYLQEKEDLKTQVAELSKSLQHYRNAYFADQGDKDAE